MLRFLAFVPLVGCIPEETTGSSLCPIVSSTPVDEATSWSGPTEQEVLDVIAAFVPTQVAWDEDHTVTAESATLEWSATRNGEVAAIVERDDTAETAAGCRPGPELVVGYDVSVSLDGGEITASFPAEIAATESDPDILLIDGLGEATVSADYDVLAASEIEEAHPGAIYDWRLGLFGELAAATVDVLAEGEDSDSEFGMVVWRGKWSE